MAVVVLCQHINIIRCRFYQNRSRLSLYSEFDDVANGFKIIELLTIKLFNRGVSGYDKIDGDDDDAMTMIRRSGRRVGELTRKGMGLGCNIYI